MDFKERFKGKISIIDKKGLKLALLKPLKQKPIIGPQNESTLKQMANGSLALQKANWRRLSRASRLRSHLSDFQNQESASRGKKLKTEHEYYTPVLKKKDRFFLDQMQEKHENFLKKLEKRTRYSTLIS